jgi:lipopolysaccharide biosynthesis glycosyltransferase
MVSHVPLILCFDVNYANYAAVATYSAHKSTKTALKIYWIYPKEISTKAEKLKKHLQNYGIHIQTVSADDSPFRAWKETFHISRGSYLRLMIPDLIEEAKVIYVDCDTLILSDLTELYSIDLGEVKVGGIFDPVGNQTSKIPRIEGDSYINSGVLLLDIRSLRNDNFLIKCRHIYNKYVNTITWADQCVLNIYAQGKKLLIEPRWNRCIFANRITDLQFLELSSISNSSILHFLGRIKPWHQSSNHLVSEFWWQFANEVNISEMES